MKLEKPIIIHHNFDGKKFSKLFSMYTYGSNPYDHCNRSLKKYFGKKFNKNNPDFDKSTSIILDEFQEKPWDAIYICGVRVGYWSKRQNEVYPHNVHFAIIPASGETGHWEFDGWVVDVENATIETVIDESELDTRFSDFPNECTTCRIYRWSVTHYRDKINFDEISSLKINAEQHVAKHYAAVAKRTKKQDSD